MWLALALLGNGLKSAQAFRKDRREDNLRTPKGLAGCLHVLHASALGLKGYEYARCHERPALLRVTIHRVVDGEDTLEQIVDYVGDESKGAGRRFSSRSGVVGRAMNTRQPALLARTDESLDSYVKTLTTDYAMPAAEATKLTNGRMSFLAVPITGNANQIVGTVFMDSCDPGFFADPASPESPDQRLLAGIITACAGLARYAESRYEKKGS